MFYGAKIDSNFEIQRDIAETDFVVIKIFDVRNKSYLEQYLNELDTLIQIKSSGVKGLSQLIDYGKTNPSNS